MVAELVEGWQSGNGGVRVNSHYTQKRTQPVFCLNAQSRIAARLAAHDLPGIVESHDAAA